MLKSTTSTRCVFQVYTPLLSDRCAENFRNFSCATFVTNSSVLLSLNFCFRFMSGGYCGKVFVTDITRFKADKLSENGIYNTANAVSSVCWNPGFAKVASASTDAGELHIFDSRIGQYERSNRVIRTRFKGLYTHAWTDTHSVVGVSPFANRFLLFFSALTPCLSV
jgi:WD40 repeat protein